MTELDTLNSKSVADLTEIAVAIGVATAEDAGKRSKEELISLITGQPIEEKPKRAKKAKAETASEAPAEEKTEDKPKEESKPKRKSKSAKKTAAEDTKSDAKAEEPKTEEKEQPKQEPKNETKPKTESNNKVVPQIKNIEIVKVKNTHKSNLPIYVLGLISIAIGSVITVIGKKKN